MILDIKKLSDMIFEMDDSDNKDNNLYQLTHMLHTMAIELDGHIGRNITIGNNEVAPLNEEKYILENYQIYKVLDGRYRKTYSFTLIVTVKNSKNESISFSYPYITHIDDDLINPETLKFWITVRNRAFDYLIDDSGNRIGSLSKDDQEMIQEHGHSVYRFFLYDN